MTAPKDNHVIAGGEQTVQAAVVSAVATHDTNPHPSDHYDISIESDHGGDPDRVHVTSISPRARN